MMRSLKTGKTMEECDCVGKSITNQRHSISHYIHHYNTTIAAILIGEKDLSMTCQTHEEVGFFDGALIVIVPSYLTHWMVKILL